MITKLDRQNVEYFLRENFRLRADNKQLLEAAKWAARILQSVDLSKFGDEDGKSQMQEFQDLQRAIRNAETSVS